MAARKGGLGKGLDSLIPIGAMDEEVMALLDRMSDVIKKEVSNVTFYEGLLAGKKVIVSKSGVGRCQRSVLRYYLRILILIVLLILVQLEACKMILKY